MRPAVARREGRLARAAEAWMSWLTERYDRSLAHVLDRRGLMLAFTAATVALTAWLYVIAPKGFIPDQDTGLVVAVLEASADSSFEEVSALAGSVSAAIRRHPEVAGVAASVGVGALNPTPNAARLTVTLVPRDDRTASAATIGERLRRDAEGIPGAMLHVQTVQDLQVATRLSRSQYQYTLSGADEADVKSWARRLADRLMREPALSNVVLEGEAEGLTASLTIDRERAGRLGVSVQAVDDTLNDAFGQRQISTVYGQANQFRVVLEAAPRYQTGPEALQQLYIAGTGGAPIPLSAFTTIERRTAPLSISHREQFPAATVSFDVRPGAALGAALEAVRRAEDASELPSTITTSFSGGAAEFTRSLAGQPWLILAAIVTIYIVLGVLYESLIHPITILSTLPSAGVGAILALMLFRLDLSIVALIGIILLMGIVKKNAIMMIDFALAAERERGLDPRAAIVEACRLRFRPITMTTLAALFGALPLALSHGPGAELRVPLGITIIGGLLVSQLVTLYTTPVIYLALEGLKRRFRGEERGAPALPVAPTTLPQAAE
jgi:multidrug efflux pump